MTEKLFLITEAQRQELYVNEPLSSAAVLMLDSLPMVDGEPVDLNPRHPEFVAGFKEGCKSGRLRGAAAARKELEAQQSDLQELHNALAANQSIWPNNWSQPVAMIAYHFHLMQAQLADAKKDAERYQFWRKQYHALGMMDCAQCAGIDLSHTHTHTHTHTHGFT